MADGVYVINVGRYLWKITIFPGLPRKPGKPPSPLKNKAKKKGYTFDGIAPTVGGYGYKGNILNYSQPAYDVKE